MRTAFIGAIAAVAVLTAIITAASPRSDQSAPAFSSIDVMDMMKNAKTLPSEQYDAH